MRRGALTLALLVLGCGPKPTQSPISPRQVDPCLLPADTVNQLDSLTVALLEPVDFANVRSPANDSERLLFRNLFDTLVRLDCQGMVQPGMAESWRADSSGAAWIMTLPEKAAFPAAGRMSAHHAAGVLEALALTDSMTARELRIDSAYAIDEQRLRVVMSDSLGDSVPRFLADPALVLINELPTGPGMGEPGFAIPTRGKLPAINFRYGLEQDPRDALDRDVDLLVTRDPLLLEYVSNRAEFSTFPLPWSRTYVLLEGSTQVEDSFESLDRASVRSSLAKDAVRAASRAAEPPYWWNGRTDCTPPPPPPTRNRSLRIVYSRDDEVARGLAERAVALARASAGLRAVGLEEKELALAIRHDTERAYVIGLPYRSLAPCRDTSVWPRDVRAIPLIDTRAFAIVRKGAPPLTVDWDGAVRVSDR